MNIISNLKDIINFALQDWSPEAIINNFNPIKEDIYNLLSTTRSTIDGYKTHLIEDEAFSDAEYEKILNTMLYCVLCVDDYENGTFCKKTCPNWEHIQTAYILHILNNLSLTPSKWNVKGIGRSMEDILNGLIAGNTNGYWGEDFYDTCYTLSALLLYKGKYSFLAHFNDVIQKSLDWIYDTIDQNFTAEKNKEWYGAGFMGAGLYLFCRHYTDITRSGYMTHDKIKQTIDKLINSLQNYDKVNYYESDLISNPTTPNEWHTAEALIGLKYYNDTSALNSGTPIDFNTKTTWLKRQCSNGLWCHNMGSRFSFVVTGRAVHALSLTDSSFNLLSLINVLKIHYKSNKETGLIYDLPVTINLLLGMSAQSTVHIKKTITDTLIGLVFRNMEELFSSLTSIKTKAEEFETKYKRVKNILLFTITTFIISSIVVLSMVMIFNLLRR